MDTTWSQEGWLTSSPPGVLDGTLQVEARIFADSEKTSAELAPIALL